MNEYFHLLNDFAESVKVLIVDDDEADREYVNYLVESGSHSSYQIEQAEDHTEALACLAQSTFDVCLIDYHLGASSDNGIELLRKIAIQYPNTSCILITGMNSDEIDQVALEAGAADFLCKDEMTAKLLDKTLRYAIHRKQMDLELQHLAHHDSLTHLVDRNLFFDRLEHLIAQSKRNQSKHAILYIDVDFFKSINDEFGHVVGDEVLKQFSGRLLKSVRTSDTVSRLGGDEFAIILEDVDSTKAHYVSQKILRSMEEPLIISGQVIQVSASIGMTCFPFDDFDPNHLLTQADQALYFAKKDGRKTYRNFNESMKQLSQESIRLEHEFRLALENGGIVPYLQPQFCMQTNRLIGFEALARWIHPERGFISPDEFIPCAEKLSLSGKLTEVILNQSCEVFSPWLSALPDLVLSVNVSASECPGKQLFHRVKTALTHYNVAAKNLDIEVTESVLMQQPTQTVSTLKELNNFGVKIAIDDFGTGYSSLSYLADLPIDVLKIDRTFVQGIGVKPQKEVIIQVIIDLAKRLKLKVVAEGAETLEQVNFLKKHRCDYIQGYYFSKPLSLDDANALALKESKRQLSTEKNQALLREANN
ncbi:GGDEF domain-containing response regulator [Pleionea sp. CnH1-48]|uniref:two-component system response regulator n=1 Tax=Pleionea sp. CnH1-48 TaxID=2954494 RepID=UPI0020986207|nr:GGDEF domain-containing response regulator [Pleionea sp. CnH1-48]MCO7223462.1 GGDEF domain-containing response regulator [Pleionea sp. CnH1-48]